MSTLTIRIDDDIAQRFSQADEDEKAKWEEAFNLWWRVYFIPDPKDKLAATIQYFRLKAAERGLTTEELEQILSEDDK